MKALQPFQKRYVLSNMCQMHQKHLSNHSQHARIMPIDERAGLRAISVKDVEIRMTIKIVIVIRKNNLRK